MRFSTRAGRAKRRLFPFVVAVTLIAMLGCSREPQPDDATAAPPQATPDGDVGHAQAIGTTSPVAHPDSFENYSLPISCSRMSDSRSTTPDGIYKNVILFSCPSHAPPAASQAVREHMRSNGYDLSDEMASADSTSIVAKKPGTHKMTFRIVADKKEPTWSVVHVQWFSKD